MLCRCVCICVKIETGAMFLPNVIGVGGWGVCFPALRIRIICTVCMCRWKGCTGNVNSNFGMAVSYLYVQKHFNNESREKVCVFSVWEYCETWLTADDILTVFKYVNDDQIKVWLVRRTNSGNYSYCMVENLLPPHLFSKHQHKYRFTGVWKRSFQENVWA
jgi:hypothetical protein